MIQQPTLPVQQTAVQQQYQQGLVPAVPEFNAIKINIVGAQVDAPANNTNIPASQQSELGQNLNYTA